MDEEKLTPSERRARKRKEAIDKANSFFGVSKDNEPSINPLDYTLSLMKAMNTYNVNFDNKTKKKWFLSSVGKKEAVIFEDLEDWRFTSVGVLARLKARAQPLEDRELITLDRKIQELKDLVSARAPKKKVQNIKSVEPKVPLKSKSDEALSAHIAEFEAMIDEFVINDIEPNFENYLKANQVPSAIARNIPKFFVKNLEEIKETIEGEDKDLVEGYSNFKKSKLKKLLKVYENIFDACDQQVVSAKTVRKPRVRKEKPAYVIASKVKFLKEDADLGVKSELPSKMVGSNELWIYNVKYRRIQVYRTLSDQKLTVKGTSILNYDVSKSFSKTLRKPENLKSMATMTKRNLAIEFENLKTKESTVSGRINEDCIILKVF